MTSSHGLGPISTASVAILAAAVLFAQNPGTPTFEVASVKPNKSGALSQGSSPQGDRFTATNVPLRFLIQMAYSIETERLIGGPDWINSERFDIVAKAEAPFSPPNQWQLMLRRLLADRFGFVVHTENREIATYALVLARRDDQLGPNLRRAATDCVTLRAQAAQSSEQDPCGLLSIGNSLVTGRMNVRGMEIGAVTGILSVDAGRPVADKTGLTGSFDWEITWTPRAFLERPFNRERFPTIDPDGLTIFTALQEQLGLKLESGKGTDVLVIDNVERPTPD